MEEGATAITVHGRTRGSFIQAVQTEYNQKVKSVDIPVIGNGDIFTPKQLLNV